MQDQQVLNCFTGYQSYVGTAMASAEDDPAGMVKAFCSYVEPIEPTFMFWYTFFQLLYKMSFVIYKCIR